jgi:hypothetical protein
MEELMTQRNMPINELNALRMGTGVQAPNIGTGQSPVPGMNPTDVLGQYGQQYQGQLAGYNADVSSDNATMGAIASVLGAFL